MEGWGRKEAAGKGEGKEIITINHSKRRQHNNRQYNAFCSVPSKEKETFNLTIEVTSERDFNSLPVKDQRAFGQFHL